MTITFNKLGTAWATVGPGTDDHPEDQTVRWGTFDGTSNAPIAYPAPHAGTVRATARLWLVFGSSTDQSSHNFEWPILGAANAPFVLQTSTDLVTWKSLTTNSNDGSVFYLFSVVPHESTAVLQNRVGFRVSRPFGEKNDITHGWGPSSTAPGDLLEYYGLMTTLL